LRLGHPEISRLVGHEELGHVCQARFLRSARLDSRDGAPPPPNVPLERIGIPFEVKLPGEERHVLTEIGWRVTVHEGVWEVVANV